MIKYKIKSKNNLKYINSNLVYSLFRSNILSSVNVFNRFFSEEPSASLPIEGSESVPVNVEDSSQSEVAPEIQVEINNEQKEKLEKSERLIDRSDTISSFGQTSINVSSFLIYNISKDNKKYYQDIFRYISEDSRSMSNVVKNDFNFLKSPQNAQLYRSVIESGWTGLSVSLMSRLVKAYQKSTLKILSNFKPLGRYYLEDISTILRNNNVIRSSRLASMNNHRSTTITNSTYGWSVGADDLLWFQISKYDKMEINMSYSVQLTKISSINITLSSSDNSLENLEISLNVKNNSFDINAVSKMKSLYSTESSFYTDSWRGVFNSLFNIENFLCVPSFSQTKDSVRVTIDTQQSKSNEIYTGYEVSTAGPLDPVIELDNKYVTDMLISMFYISEFRHSKTEKDNLIKYLYTTLVAYCTTKISSSANVRLFSLDIKFSCSRKVNDSQNLHLNYSKFVSKGLIIPRGHLQMSYLVNKRNINDFKIYSFYACLANIAINPEFEGVLISLPSVDKYNFRRYATNRFYLNSSSYLSNVSAPEIMKINKKIKWIQFIKEYWFRSLINDQFTFTPMFVSRGEWNSGDGKSSLKVDIPRTNNITYKFEIDSIDDKFRTLIDDILKTTSDLREVKTTYRLVDKFPDLSNIFLPQENFDDDINFGFNLTDDSDSEDEDGVSNCQNGSLTSVEDSSSSTGDLSIERSVKVINKDNYKNKNQNRNFSTTIKCRKFSSKTDDTDSNLELNKVRPSHLRDLYYWNHIWPNMDDEDYDELPDLLYQIKKSNIILHKRSFSITLYISIVFSVSDMLEHEYNINKILDMSNHELSQILKITKITDKQILDTLKRIEEYEQLDDRYKGLMIIDRLDKNRIMIDFNTSMVDDMIRDGILRYPRSEYSNDNRFVALFNNCISNYFRFIRDKYYT